MLQVLLHHHDVTAQHGIEGPLDGDHRVRILIPQSDLGPSLLGDKLRVVAPLTYEGTHGIHG